MAPNMSMETIKSQAYVRSLVQHERSGGKITSKKQQKKQSAEVKGGGRQEVNKR